jgi:carbonic anhydrase
MNALKALQEGNARWAEGKPIHPRSDFARRKLVVEGQKPFAAILSCADSRVPPELLFDQGVGDLFAVRVAGNSLDQLGLQSLEYAVNHLGVETIMVLGHQNCGAVKGAVDMYPAAAPEFLSAIYQAITKALEIIKARAGNPPEKEVLCREAADQHVMVGIRQLQSMSPFKQSIELGKLKVIGGRYDLDTGRVTMLVE